MDQIKNYHTVSAIHAERGINGIVELHDRALAALARAKELASTDSNRCTIELCEAAAELLAVADIVEGTSMGKFTDSITRFINGIVVQIHKTQKAASPEKAIDFLAVNIRNVRNQWEKIAKYEEQHSASDENPDITAHKPMNIEA